MPIQWWSPEVQAHEQHLYFDMNLDTWIFRDRQSGAFFAVGGIDPLGIEVIMTTAAIVKYTNQRLRHVDHDELRGFFHR